jgi:hypothetical protein
VGRGWVRCPDATFRRTGAPQGLGPLGAGRALASEGRAEIHRTGAALLAWARCSRKHLGDSPEPIDGLRSPTCVETLRGWKSGAPLGSAI